MADPPDPPLFSPSPELILKDPQAIPIIFHKERGLILHQLMQREMTLRELAETLKINPGTVKRHLNDLLLIGVIVPLPERKNDYGITLKYYRAKALRILFQFEFPKDFSAEKPTPI